MHIRTRIAAVLALIVIALVAGASAAPSRAVAATPLDWTPCGGGFECATLDVPLDYSAPNGAQISLALIRMPAPDPSQRIGALLTDPGGPGASGVNFVRGWARSLDPSIRARFDIVGWDPRGIGQSTPALVCHATLQQFAGVDPDPQTPAAWRQVEQVSKTFADQCEQQYPDLLPHLGSLDVARDMDRIREALGESTLTYVGYSYGTVLGQLYASLFPSHVRAIVLDGPVDIAETPDGFMRGQAAGFEDALNRYIAACRANGCALAANGADPLTQIETVLARARATPIPAPGADRPAGPGEVMLGIITPLYHQSSWPLLTRALESALNGDGTELVRLTDAYLGRGRNGEYGNESEVNAAVNCLDDTWPRDLAHYETLADELRQTAPVIGPSLAVEGVICAVWPVDPQPLAVPHYDGKTPLLVVGTTHDPATPFAWALGVRHALASSVLLTHQGDGHTAYGGSVCVDDVVNAYLLTLAVPQDGAICGTGSAPAAPPTPPAAAVASAAASAAANGGTPAAALRPTPSGAGAAPGSTGGTTTPATAEPSPVLASVLIAIGAAIVAFATVVWWGIRERRRGGD